MIFDWNEYLLLARELTGDSTVSGNEEAKMRSAISRAYYAAIIQARNKIGELTDKPYSKNERISTFLWTIKGYFNYARESSQGRLASEIGEELKRFKKIREMVDYDDEVDNVEAELESALIRTEKLIEMINKLA